MITILYFTGVAIVIAVCVLFLRKKEEMEVWDIIMWLFLSLLSWGALFMFWGAAFLNLKDIGAATIWKKKKQ